MIAFNHSYLMVRCGQDNRLPCKGLWLGMITKLDCLSLTPISSMCVRHEVTRFLFLAKRLWIVISSGGSKLFKTLHTIYLYYIHKNLARRPQVPMKSFGVISFRYFLSFSLASKYLAISSTLTNMDFILKSIWLML